MYTKKAIGILEYIKKWFDDQFVHEEDDAIDTAIKALEKVQQYRAIGTVEECREAVEKQKKINPIIYKGTNRADCPICGGTVRGIDKPFGDYCSKCGQAIDWTSQ